MKKQRNINLDSKNTFANQISGSKLDKVSAKKLIENVISNHSALWKDNDKASDPVKGKWVRSAYGTDLGKLLKLIDTRVLAHLDDDLPNFVFGGRKGMSNITAAKHLMGYEKERKLLALDITKFFESVQMSKVEKFYIDKKCSQRFARSLALFSCVKKGPKDEPEEEYSLARGFSTSTRLAVWSYVNAFHRINDLVIKRLKGHDPRMAIFIDDIGISASRVDDNLMMTLVDDVNKILDEESKGTLKLNKGKTKLMTYKDSIKHLGVVINRNKLVMPVDMRAKLDWLRYAVRTKGMKGYDKQRRGYQGYHNSIKKMNEE